MNINRVDQQTFGANLVFAKDASTRFSKNINLENVSKIFAERTKNLKTDMVVQPFEAQTFFAEYGKEGSIYHKVTPVISWAKEKDDATLADKFVKLYKMFMAKCYSKQAERRGDFSDALHFEQRISEIATKSEDKQLLKTALELVGDEY